jgi:TIGR03943 family protein
MRRYAQTALLVLLGGMLIKLVATNTHVRYVRAGYAPLLLLTGVVLLVVAAVTLWRDLRSDAITRDDDTIAGGLKLDGIFGVDRARAARAAAEATREVGAVHRDRALAAGRAAAAHEGLGETPGDLEPTGMHAPTTALETVRTDSFRTDGRRPVSGAAAGSGLRPQPSGSPASAVPAGSSPASSGPTTPIRRRTSVGWVLVAAAVSVLVIAPPALGSFSVVRAGTLDGSRAVGAVPEGDPVPMTLAEYAAQATAGGQALAGRRVRLVGFVIAGPRREPFLARLTMGCCAAGAQPVKIGLTGDLPGMLTADTWVEVVGVYTDQVGRDPVNGAPIPYISVVEVATIEPPANPYES